MTTAPNFIRIRQLAAYCTVIVGATRTFYCTRLLVGKCKPDDHFAKFGVLRIVEIKVRFLWDVTSC